MESAPTFDRSRGVRFWIAVLAFAAATAAAAGFGSYFRPGPWYDELTRPSWTPPDWVFPVVWPVLYLTIAIAPILVWVRERERARTAYALWAVQLVLNAAWSWIFFGEHAIGWALVDITALFVAIAATMAAFRRVHELASWVLLPYLLWVGFASTLNFALWRLNT